jgi:hypothetical protein
MNSDYIRHSNGQQIRIPATSNDPLHGKAGGEGTICPLPGGKEVAKIYHPGKSGNEQRAKLEILVAHPPLAPVSLAPHVVSYAWPSDLLLDAQTKQLAGFVMPRIKTAQPLPVWYNPLLRLKEAPNFTYRNLIEVAANLAGLVYHLHQTGIAHGCNYVIGDMNESNFLVTDRALVSMVDCDSIQVSDPRQGRIHRCAVKKDEYQAPEFAREMLKGHDPRLIERNRHTDDFSLAVLIFQLLSQNHKPWKGGDQDKVAQKIVAGDYANLTDAGPLAMLPDPLKALFHKSFRVGHLSPSERPDAGTWQQALQQAGRQMTVCSKNPQHVYFDHLTQCTWCRLAQQKVDLFPAPRCKVTPKPVPQPLPALAPQSAHVPVSVAPATGFDLMWLWCARTIQAAAPAVVRGWSEVQRFIQYITPHVQSLTHQCQALGRDAHSWYIRSVPPQRRWLVNTALIVLAIFAAKYLLRTPATQHNDVSLPTSDVVMPTSGIVTPTPNVITPTPDISSTSGATTLAPSTPVPILNSALSLSRPLDNQTINKSPIIPSGGAQPVSPGEPPAAPSPLTPAPVTSVPGRSIKPLGLSANALRLLDPRSSMPTQLNRQEQNASSSAKGTSITTSAPQHSNGIINSQGILSYADTLNRIARPHSTTSRVPRPPYDHTWKLPHVYPGRRVYTNRPIYTRRPVYSSRPAYPAIRRNLPPQSLWRPTRLGRHQSNWGTPTGGWAQPFYRNYPVRHLYPQHPIYTGRPFYHTRPVYPLWAGRRMGR